MKQTIVQKLDYFFTYKVCIDTGYKIQRLHVRLYSKWQKVLRWHYKGMNKNVVPHWFKTYYNGCVLCGRDGTEKAYMYGKKPKEHYLTHEYSEYACDSHFM